MKTIITVTTMLVAGLSLAGPVHSNAADTSVSAPPAILADLAQQSSPTSVDAPITALDESELAAARGEFTLTYSSFAVAAAVWATHYYGKAGHGPAHKRTTLERHGGIPFVNLYWHVHHPQ